MNLYDSRQSYGAVSRMNHWLGAIAVVVLLGIGLYFHEMPRGDERVYWLKLHVALGVLASLFLLFRVIWRFVARSPDAVAQSAAMRKFALVMHAVLLLTIVTLVVTGPFMVWTAGREISVFDWFAIPGPLGEMEAVHEFLEGVHAVASRVLLIGAILHVVGAMKHALIDRDGTLRRMLG